MCAYGGRGLGNLGIEFAACKPGRYEDLALTPQDALVSDLLLTEGFLSVPPREPSTTGILALGHPSSPSPGPRCWQRRETVTQESGGMGPPSPNVRPGRRPGRSQPWPTPGALPPDAWPAVLWPGDSSPGLGRHSTWTPSGGSGGSPNHVTLPAACRGGGLSPLSRGGD